MKNYSITELKKMVISNDTELRKEVARQGYGLETLINDEDESVRKVAQQELLYFYVENVKEVEEANFVDGYSINGITLPENSEKTYY